MKISLVEQNSPEWFKLRLGRFTGSKAHLLVGQDSTKLTQKAKKYAFLKAKEIIYGERRETPTTKDMEWGNINEPIAAKEYQKKYDCFAHSVGFYYCDHYGSSPDKLVSKSGVVEFKCAPVHHLDYCLLKTQEDIYKKEKLLFWQCYMNMLCTGRFWCDFVAFDPRLKNHLRLHVVRIHRQDHIMKRLTDSLKLAIIEKQLKLNELGMAE